jgi:hypothetical protein
MMLARGNMEIQKKKKRIVSSSAAIISIGLHVALILLAGGMVAMKFYKKKGAGFQIDQKPKLERRKLQMPVKAEPFIEQMSKPKLQTTSRITANSPQMVNIPEQGEYVKMAPMPTFKGGYTNFVQMDRTLEFNSKYRDVSFGISAVDFFGTRGKAEKVVIVVDTSRSMLFDNRGGADSYQMVHEDLREVIGRMRSATLFNVVLFDNNKVSLFNPSMTPATPTGKTNVLQWIGGINTNLAHVGISKEMNNYSPQTQYDIPMASSDISGWLRGFQAAAEMKPEIIFVLSSDWGNVTTKDGKVSYFMNHSKFNEYQKRRAELFLADDSKEVLDEFLTEFNQLRAGALKMLELENQARIEAGMQPKVVRDWDEILFDNKIRLPRLPLAENLQDLEVNPVETRYTTDEVHESIFIMVMDNYRQRGFPQVNFVMLTADGASKKGTTEGASMMTSDSKFNNLSKMVGGRFRYLKGMPRVENLLDQDLDDVLELLESAEL